MKNQVHRERKGFTIVEALVYIVLATLVIILGVGIFRYVTKNAVVKANATSIVDTMRQVRTAAQVYLLENTKEATGLSDLSLASKPVPPASAKDPDYTGTYEYTWTTDLNVQGSSSNDVTLTLKGVNDDVCKKINELYTGLGATIPSSLSSDYTYQCYNDGTNNVVVGVLYVH